MTWAQWLVGATFLLGLAWQESWHRQTHNPFRRSRAEQIEQIHARRRTLR